MIIIMTIMMYGDNDDDDDDNNDHDHDHESVDQ